MCAAAASLSVRSVVLQEFWDNVPDRETVFVNGVLK
jgi:hypothetical protein